MVEYTLLKHSDDLLSIEEGGVRSFLVLGAGKALLIDTGMDGEGILDFAKSATNLPITLLTTHADGDHVGGHNNFAEAWMHPSEFELFKEKANYDIQLMPLWEGVDIDLGTSKWEVIHIPGHTPGSIALKDAKGRLIVGDSVQNGNVFMFGRGRNLDAFVASMEKLAKRQAEFTEVYPSHSDPVVPPSKIGDILKGASLLAEGKGEAIKLPETMHYSKFCNLYDFGYAKFLY